MSYILLLIFYTGKVETVYYSTQQSCEMALFESTDAGKRKELRVAECYKIKK
jgi:hypothetical protein